MQAEPLYATPPVRGDREAIAKALAITMHGDDVEWRGFLTKADTFAAALPVQPGAGSDIRIDKAYAEGVRACLRRLEHLRKSTDDKAWKDCEAMWRNRIAEIEASRQPPQSSSDTK